LKQITTLIFFLVTRLAIWGQMDIKPTSAFTVSGQIEHEARFTISDLEKYKPVKIDDLVVTNHLGVTKSTVKGLKGILIKELLTDLKFKAESPKIMSEFYLTFIASDGYKVVYSWNEIFNDPTGDHIYLVTEKENIPISTMEDRILIITTSDFKTGQRHIKGLDKILVGRVD